MFETLEAVPLKLDRLTVPSKPVPIDIDLSVVAHRPPKLDRLALCPDLEVLDLDIVGIDFNGGIDQRLLSSSSSPSFSSSSAMSMTTSFSVDDISKSLRFQCLSWVLAKLVPDFCLHRADEFDLVHSWLCHEGIVDLRDSPLLVRRGVQCAIDDRQLFQCQVHADLLVVSSA